MQIDKQTAKQKAKYAIPWSLLNFVELLLHIKSYIVRCV